MAIETKIGKTFGQWTIIGVGFLIKSNRKYLCRCSCGVSKYVTISNLTSGRSSKCLTCGRKTSAIKSMARARIRHGQKYIPKPKRTGLCLDCGCDISTTSYMTRRCRTCSGLARRGKSYGARKFPRLLWDVAREVGVTKQAISRQVKLLGWNGMLDYYGIKP